MSQNKVCTVKEYSEACGYKLNTSMKIIEGRIYDAGTIWYRESDGSYMTLWRAKTAWVEAVGDEYFDDLTHYTDRLGNVVQR